MHKEIFMMEGNEAIAEAAFRAGIDLYAGYPITPQSEILEYLSVKMRESGRAFIQAENETSAASMLIGASMTGKRVLTSSSGPGITLKQEGFTYAAENRLPIVFVNAMRGGNGLAGGGTRQTEYKRDTNGGGNGDYRVIIYSPGFVQEAIDMTYNAYEIAEKYRNLVEIQTETTLCHLIEACVFPPAIDVKSRILPEWRRTGESQPVRAKNGREPFRPYSPADQSGKGYDKYTYEKMIQDIITENEQQWENLYVNDAEYVMVAFGVTGRMCISVVEKLRAQGEKVGLIRCKTLWPYPVKAFKEIDITKIKGIIPVETNATGQMAEDAAIARLKAFKEKYIPVYSLTFTDDVLPRVKEVIDGYNAVKAGIVKEAY